MIRLFFGNLALILTHFDVKLLAHLAKAGRVTLRSRRAPSV